MRRGEYRKFRIALGFGIRGSVIRRNALGPKPESRITNHAIQDDFAAMHEVVLRRYRKLLEQGGPFPDLDPDRRRQGPAVGGVRGARGARARESRRGRHREEGRAAVHARPRRSDRAGRQRSGAAAAPADSRRGASLRGDVSPPRADDARSAVGARRRARHRPAPPPDAADDVRQPGRRAARDARGAGGRRRRESRRCRPCVFRRAGRNLYTPCPTSTSRRSSSRSSSCCFP